MLQRLCRWILYKRMGWTTTITVDHPAKFIICLAPHTSNWDFIMGQVVRHGDWHENQLHDEARVVFLADGHAVQKDGRHTRRA